MTDNENLELKKRSRRRLVGAAALALLAAIVLPMVMDQEPAPTAQDIQVSIPDHDADNASTRPIAGRPGHAADSQLPPPPDEDAPGAVSAADAPATSGAQGDAAAPAPAPVATAAARATPSAPAVPSASAPRASSPTTDAAPQPSSVKPVPAPSVSVAAPPKDEAARVRALLEGMPAPAKESFVVQVGAFGEPAKAASLIADLKNRGLSAYSEKAGNVTRVRVGPFASRDQAEKAAERLRANGLNGVVAPR